MSLFLCARCGCHPNRHTDSLKCSECGSECNVDATPLYGQPVDLQIPRDLRARIVAHMQQTGVSADELFTAAIENYLNECDGRLAL